MPEKIIYKNSTYVFDSKSKNYFSTDTGYNIRYRFPPADLNDEVELIEEQQDIDIQELEELNAEDLIIHRMLDTETKTEETILNGTLGKKINELIKAIKQLDRNIRKEK